MPLSTLRYEVCSPSLKLNLPVANFSTISGISVGHFSGKSYFPIMETASLNCFCIASGDLSIKFTMRFLIETLSAIWMRSTPSSSWNYFKIPTYAHRDGRLIRDQKSYMQLHRAWSLSCYSTMWYIQPRTALHIFHWVLQKALQGCKRIQWKISLQHSLSRVLAHSKYYIPT